MQPVIVGRIGAPHGVQGWVRIQSWTRPPESILDFPQWWIADGSGWQAYRPVETRVREKSLLVRLEGCEGRDGAAALRNAEIAVPRDALPAPTEKEWYWVDLIGLEVKTVAGVSLGLVDHLIETGANDVLVVHGDRERLIPWIVDEVIREVNPESGRIVVDWDPEF